MSSEPKQGINAPAPPAQALAVLALVLHAWRLRGVGPAQCRTWRCRPHLTRARVIASIAVMQCYPVHVGRKWVRPVVSSLSSAGPGQWPGREGGPHCLTLRAGRLAGWPQPGHRSGGHARAGGLRSLPRLLARDPVAVVRAPAGIVIELFPVCGAGVGHSERRVSSRARVQPGARARRRQRSTPTGLAVLRLAQQGSSRGSDRHVLTARARGAARITAGLNSEEQRQGQAAGAAPPHITRPAGLGRGSEAAQAGRQPSGRSPGSKAPAAAAAGRAAA